MYFGNIIYKHLYDIKNILTIDIIIFLRIELKGLHLDPNFNVVIGKQGRTENAYAGHQYNIFI